MQHFQGLCFQKKGSNWSVTPYFCQFKPYHKRCNCAKSDKNLIITVGKLQVFASVFWTNDISLGMIWSPKTFLLKTYWNKIGILHSICNLLTLTKLTVRSVVSISRVNVERKEQHWNGEQLIQIKSFTYTDELKKKLITNFLEYVLYCKSLRVRVMSIKVNFRRGNFLSKSFMVSDLL